MDEASVNIRVGRVLRQSRMAQGISQDKLADMIAMHRAYYGAIERGAHNITLATLLRVCEGLGTAPSEVLRSAGL